MSRRRRHSNSQSDPLARSLYPNMNATPRVLSGTYIVPTSPLDDTYVSDFGNNDLRTFNPSRQMVGPAAVIRRAARIVHKDPFAHLRAFPTPSRIKQRVKSLKRLSFNIPQGVAICVRRKMRSQVLHALRKTGRRGNGRGKPRHTNFWSRIGC